MLIDIWGELYCSSIGYPWAELKTALPTPEELSALMLKWFILRRYFLSSLSTRDNSVDF